MTLRQARPSPKLSLRQPHERAEALERAQAAAVPSPRWWLDHAGRFVNDPGFDEIVRLGRAYREAENRKARRGNRVSPRPRHADGRPASTRGPHA